MESFTSMALERANSSTTSMGQGAFVKSKWQLLKVVEDIREPLGLKGTSIALLRALLSFLQTDTVSGAKDETHVCFASNASLARRAHVSIQTVERHIAKLVSVGLIARKPSGNGKRWARRNGQGQIVYATGLSLLPLLQRHDEYLKLADEHQAQQLQLTLLRDQCAEKLAELKERVFEGQTLSVLQSRARNILRRKPNADALNALLVDIIEELSTLGVPDTEELRGADHEIEGHKETSLNPLVEKPHLNDVQVSQHEMEAAFPKLCNELRLAPSHQSCLRQMDTIADYLNLGELWFSVKEMGPALSFMMLGYLFEREDHIRNPKAYAWRLCTDLSNGSMTWQSLLKKPQRAAERLYGAKTGQGATYG